MSHIIADGQYGGLQFVILRTVHQQGFDLHHHTWALFNQPMCCKSSQCGLAKFSLCKCQQLQAVNLIIDMCLLTKFEGRLQLLHNVDTNAFNWLESGNHSDCCHCEMK